MSTVDIIKSLSFFKILDDEQLLLLSSFAKIDNYYEEYLLYYDNTGLDKILFLVDGLAKAYKIDKHDNEVFLYYIYPNSMISDLSSFDNDTLTSYCNISIERPSRILSIEYKRFQNQFLKKGMLHKEIAIEVMNQSRQLRNIVNREFVFDSVSKVSMMLFEDLEMFNKLKRYDVSLMLHIQPATLSRVLNRLSRDNIISITKGKVVVLDLDRLENIYEGLK